MKTFLFSFIVLSCYTCAVWAGNWDVQVAKYKHNKVCAISYTFDDGLAQQYSMVAPELERRGFRGTFAINGFKIDTDTTRMTWAQVKDLFRRGHEISNHGWKHKNAGRTPFAEFAEDVRKNDSAIFAAIGEMPRTFVYPNNVKKPVEARKFAEQNRVGTRTRQIGIGGRSTAEGLDKWVSKLIEKGDWGVGMTHGITYGYDRFRFPSVLWEHFDRVKSAEDSIWVGTFKEVSAYVKEREAVRFSVEKPKKGLRITPQLNLDKELFDEPLTMIVGYGVMKKVSVKQGRKKLKVRYANDKVMFDFDPYGEPIDVKVK